MSPEDRKKLEEIRERLNEYRQHQNDPYAYYPEEIDAVRALKTSAPKDIEFLLEQLKKR